MFTLLFFAYVVRIFEMPRFRLSKDDTFDWYFNSCWFTVVTLTTIGYGDFSPMTMPGKIVTIALAFWGALLLSLLVIIMSTIFNLDENEKMVLRQVNMTKQAAGTILKGIRYFMSKKRTQMLQHKAG